MLFAAMLMWAQAVTAAPTTALPGWMAGCWITREASADAPRTEECWTLARGQVMLGSSHSFIADTTHSFEHMRIERRGVELAFVAQPGGASPTHFALIDSGVEDGRPWLLFGNPAHDYPQHVRYALATDGALIGEISMADGSRVMRWRYYRQ